MGRSNVLPQNLHAQGKLHLEQIRFQDGDCDKGGAYWGYSKGYPMYVAHGDLEEVAAQVFFRGHTRQEAKEKIWKLLPNVTFYR